MNFSSILPKNLEKTINDLARAREKAAKQKYLLDLGESLVMHLCSFVLGEYKESMLTSIDLEKSFLKNSKNVSFGVYLGWLRESSKFLNAEKRPSEIHNLLHGSLELKELSEFGKAFETLKSLVENNTVDYHPHISNALKNNLGKTNLLQFFDLFIQLRNRVAHPHKEIKGKVVTWPFTEEYFDSTNPFLEHALNRAINELSKIWEFRNFIIESNEEGILTLKNEDSGEFEEIATKSNLPEGVKVFANPSKTILLSDWKLLLKAGDEAIERIRQEEEDLRNKATIDDLKQSIRAALEDEQISLDEQNFFESLGKTKLGLSKEEVKKIILDVANSMDIDDPFPEVDKRFIELIDNAIKTKTYNEFLLKLTGQQYGVDNESFEKVFNDRTFALDVDPEDVKKNKVLQFTSEELNAFQGLTSSHKWLMGMSSLKKHTKESIYKIKEDSYVFGTKEYWHRTAFNDLENFVKIRLKKLAIDELAWDTNQNNWQIGAMTSYAWCTIYPKNLATKKILALHISLYSDGSAAIGYLPDWKDYKGLENYGLLLSVFVNHLKSFAKEYEVDLNKYPNLVLWDGINNNKYYSFTDSMKKFPWFYEHIYGFDQIQFIYTAKEIISNPSILIDGFDITFNLFNGLFEGINRDYLNMLNIDFLINTEEKSIRKRLTELEPIFANFGLCETQEEDKEKNTIEDEDGVQEERLDSEENTISTDGLKGSAYIGYLAREFRSKVKGYPLFMSFQIKQDYSTNKLNYLISISCAGYLQPDIHLTVERVLESMQDLKFENTTFFFKRSKFLVVMPIDDIHSFDAAPLTNYFLEIFASSCSKALVPFLGLKIHAPIIDLLQPYMIHTLEETKNSIADLFRNELKVERNWKRNCRFIDYVYGSKSMPNWVGWGFELRKSQLYAGVIFHVRNSIKGESLKQQMELISAENTGWEFQIVGEEDPVDPEWILNDVNSYKFSASTEHSKPHTALHALLSNKKTYWAAKVKNAEQWWQVETKEPMLFSKLKFTGAPHGNSYMELFDLNFSMDGTTWQTIQNIEGISNGLDIKEITFEEAFSARFIRINPIKFIGWPGFRIDFFAKKIMPNQIELQWLKQVNHEQEIEEIFNEIPSKIMQIKNINGIGI